jgi:hypothetical protein
MAYVTNGEYRHLTLTVQKKRDGAADGAPLQYTLTEAFTVAATATSYPALSTEAFQRLDETTYQQRLAQFLAFVNEQVGHLFSPAIISNNAHGNAALDQVAVSCANQL